MILWPHDDIPSTSSSLFPQLPAPPLTIDHFTVTCAILKANQAFASKWGWSWPCNDRDLWIIVKDVKKRSQSLRSQLILPLTKRYCYKMAQGRKMVYCSIEGVGRVRCSSYMSDFKTNININIRGQMINCPHENSQASGPMMNRAGCKHVYHPASDLQRMNGAVNY
jgi:hypothetical protein